MSFLLTASVVTLCYCLSLAVGAKSESGAAKAGAVYPEYDYDVIIMGAGMTGISAGHTLFEDRLGFKNILIIEAQDYVGGRTKTTEFAGFSFNVGASWIEGYCDQIHTDPKACAYMGHTPTKENPMQTLAKKYNLAHTPQGTGGGDYFEQADITMLSFIPEGSNASVNIADEAEVTAAFVKWNATQQCLQRLMQEIYLDITYQTALFRCGWAQPLTAIEKAVQFTGYTFEFANLPEFASFYGSEQNVFRDFGRFLPFITDPRGYPGITLGVAAEYLDIANVSNESKLRLNSPITRVEYTYAKKIRVTIANADGSTETVTARYGIVTFSLGVFKSNLVTYAPPLDNAKSDALLEEAMADYLPVLVQFPYNFWDALGMTTHGFVFADPRDTFWIWAYNFDHADFYPGSHVWRFDLCVGDARRVQFQSHEDTIQELVMQKMRHFFGEGVMPTPTAITFEGWHANKYVQGSYSNWQMGMNSAKWAETLRPYVEEGLFFGGEALAIYSGEVEGAYLDGIRVANEVIACARGVEHGGYECPTTAEIRAKNRKVYRES